MALDAYWPLLIPPILPVTLRQTKSEDLNQMHEPFKLKALYPPHDIQFENSPEVQVAPWFCGNHNTRRQKRSQVYCFAINLFYKSVQNIDFAKMSSTMTRSMRNMLEWNTRDDKNKWYMLALLNPMPKSVSGVMI